MTPNVTTPNFMGRAATIIAEVRTRTCMDNIDIEVLKEFLQHALHECYDAGYDAGYGEGYDDGYDGVYATSEYSSAEDDTAPL